MRGRDKVSEIGVMQSGCESLPLRCPREFTTIREAVGQIIVHIGEELQLLRHQHRTILSIDGSPTKFGFAEYLYGCRWCPLAAQRPQQRGLACAGRPHHHDDASGWNFEFDRFENPSLAVRDTE